MISPAEQHIEHWPIDRLVEYSRNPRKNDKAVDRMCSSIREFGLKIPCLVRSDGEVVDGHLRLKAARKLGITEIPVILCDEWTPAQVKAFRLMVNRSVTWATGMKNYWRLSFRRPGYLSGGSLPTGELPTRGLLARLVHGESGGRD
jgi:hypothetical protein